MTEKSLNEDGNNDSELLARFACAILQGGRPPYDLRPDLVSEYIYDLSHWLLVRHKETVGKITNEQTKS